MKTASLIIVSLMLAQQALGAAGPDPAGRAAFDKLGSLAGDWHGKESGAGPAVDLSLKPTADGSALMENLGLHGGMLTVYHLDGDRLMMTHYCAAHNQPRMRAEPFAATDKSITFNFLDATNLADPNDAHMHKLVVTFIDADHFRQEWTLRSGVKDVMIVTIDYQRAR